MAHDSTLTTTIAGRSNALQLFVILQCLDALTTLTFLRMGLAEGNGLVSWALYTAHAPWIGLIFTKLLAALIGLYCYRSRRVGLLRRANAGYSLVVAWNLLGIAAAAIVH